MEPIKENDPKQLGDWRIMGRLGQGGGGTVFLAERGAQKAAVKMLLQDFVDDEIGREQLAIEAEVLKKLTDPSIGKIIDADLDGEIPWIATEFINGPTLEVKVKYEGPLRELQWFRLASDLFHAITTAHDLGITHKDVKPSNIVLGETGTKLIDFGIAHVSGRTRTMHFGDREGSTPFSSPEHFLPKSNPKMDVFSAAATLAYAGKGQSIWSGKSELQLMRNINEDEPDLSNLTERQITFLTPLLSKNHSERSSAREALNSANSFIEELIPLVEKTERKFLRHNLRPSKRYKNFPKKTFSSGISLLLIAGVFVYTTSNNEIAPPVSKELGAVSSAGKNAVMPTPAKILEDAPSTDPTPDTSKSAPQNRTKSSGAKPALSELSKCVSFVEAEDFLKATTACISASKKGNLDALYNLGLSYNGTKELQKARATFENCSKRQDYRCSSELAYFLSREGKTDEAREMWESAVDKGWGDAALALGVSYNIKKDFDSAIKWWKKAAELGETQAQTYISDAYLNDLKDYEKALTWAMQMLKDKVPGADQRIGYIYNLQGKKEEAKQYLTNCGNAGNVSCMSMLSLIYYDEKDSPKAVIWAKRAAKENFAPSYNLLTRIYMWLDYDLAQAKIWAQKSASTGDLEGIFTMGGLFALVDNDIKSSCLQYSQVIAKSNAMFKNNTDTPDTTDWLAKANEQYQKRDCKNVLS
jgi:serine/threonine protein kinase